MKRSRTRAIASCILVASVAPSCLAGAQQAEPTFEAILDSTGAHFVARYGLVGLQVAVVRDTHLLFSGAWGFADLATLRPLTTRTPLAYGSITKTFTAALVHRTARGTRRGLAATLAEWWPEAPGPAAGVTLRQLLTHTGGVPNHGDGPANRSSGPLLAIDAPRWIATQALDFPPGARQRYSNTGYLLLGHAVEAKAGVPWSAMVRRLANDVGARDVAPCTLGREGASVGFESRGGVAQPAEALDPSVTWSGGSLCGPAESLARWGAALRGRVLDEESWQAACALPAGMAGATFGAGLVCDRWKARPRALHSGRVPGGVGVLAIFPDDSIAIAILSNTGGGVPIQGLLSRVSGTVLGLVPRVVRDDPLAPDEAAAFRGAYQRDSGVEQVIVENGRLVLQSAAGPRFRLLPLGPREFGAAFDLLVRVRFDAPVAGRSPAITIEQGERTSRALRLPDAPQLP